jgi:hypothetical protein
MSNDNGSTLSAARSTRRSREELLEIPTPMATATWRPVPHHELVDHLHRDFASRGIEVVREQYATAGALGERLFGVMDLRAPGLNTPDIGTSLGLRAGNDRSMAIQVIAAARVMVCDNMCMSGSDGAVVLKKKHTSGLDLAAIVPKALGTFLEKAAQFRLDIDRMRQIDLPDAIVKSLIYEAFLEAKVLPFRLLPDVHGLYFDDDVQRAKFPDRTMWSLNNAFTESVKRLGPVPQHRHGQQIGRYFGGKVHRYMPNRAALPTPDVVDAV